MGFNWYWNKESAQKVDLGEEHSPSASVGSSTLPLSCSHSPTFSAQLGCLLLLGPLPCGHFQCTAGLCFCQVPYPVVTFMLRWTVSASVRSLTLLSFSVHSWAVCFCQVPYPVVTFSAQLGCLLSSCHLPCGHFHAQLDCLLLSGPLPCGHFQCTPGLCFCQVIFHVVTFSAQLSQVNRVMTVNASAGSLTL